MVYPALLPLMCTPRLPVVDWTDAPSADLNGPIRFARKTKSGLCACAITFQKQSNNMNGYLLTQMRTPRLSVVDWTDAPADLNVLGRFAERRNLISARVPSHFKRSLPYRRVSVSTSSLISTHCVKAYSWHAQFRGIQQVAPGQTSKTSEFVFGCWLRQWSFADRTLPSCCIWIYIALDTNLHRFAQ